MGDTPVGRIQCQVPQGVQEGQTFHVTAAAQGNADFSAVGTAGGQDIEANYTPYEPMEDMRFDFTDPFASFVLMLVCPCQGWTTQSLLLQDQDVFFQTKNMMFSQKQRRPYAQLGSVDMLKNPCGCNALVSDFAPLNEKGQGGLRAGFCGTNGTMVETAVQELQRRKFLRGGVGQIRKLDYVLDKAARVATQAPLLAKKLGVNVPKMPKPNVQKQVLQPMEIDIGQPCDVLNCTSKKLILTPEEAIMQITMCGGLSKYTTKREYGELGFVEKNKSCGCCFKVASDISPIPGRGDMVPGCPCANRSKVTQIVQELRARMAVRGQVGQIKKQEKILDFIRDIEQTMMKVKDRRGLPFPPTQQEMVRRFGESPPELGVPVEKEEAPESKTYDVTNKLDSLIGLFATCFVQGWTTETVELDEDYMWIISKNNFDDSNTKIPYAELDSVDVEQKNCCMWSVNDMSPGWGCNREQVEELAGLSRSVSSSGATSPISSSCGRCRQMLWAWR